GGGSMADDKHKPGSDPQGAPKFPFTPQDAFEFMQRMWNPLGIPMPGFPPPSATSPGGSQGSVPFPMPAAMFAALDPAEIDRKIAELRIVENWLAMSLSMMQMSIKTMELQKASIEAMRGGGSSTR
ncbi:MAG: PhaM family polyhydroxyalkanoate granule multifunctional regulatory protein, partial [Burkholderiales bacterium]